MIWMLPILIVTVIVASALHTAQYSWKFHF